MIAPADGDSYEDLKRAGHRLLTDMGPRKQAAFPFGNDECVYALGEPSWQLRSSTSTRLDALLYLRDALRLPAVSPLAPPTFPAPVAPAWNLPAPRTGAGSDATTGTQGTTAAWNAWWRDQVAHDLHWEGLDLTGSRMAPAWARSHPPRPQLPGLDRQDPGFAEPDQLGQVSRYLEQLEAHLPRAPRYEDVRDPVLRQAALQLMTAADEWAEALQLAAARLKSWDEATAGTHVPESGPSVGVVHRVAEEVASDAGVPTAGLHAHLVTVEGITPWWQQWAPGTVVCTRAALLDPLAADQLLREAFRSYLGDRPHDGS